jgi:hypothetical protein
MCGTAVLADRSSQLNTCDLGETNEARLRGLAEVGRLVAAQVSVLQARLCAIAAEVVALGGSLAAGTPREWLAHQLGLTPGEAARVVRIGTRLDTVPAIRDAFEGGRFSEGTIDTLLRVATPENEGRLLDTAEAASSAQLQTLVRDLKRASGVQDGAEPAPPPPESLDWYVDECGMFRLRGRLAADHGAVLASAIDAARSLDLDDAGAGATPLTNAEALNAVAEVPDRSGRGPGRWDRAGTVQDHPAPRRAGRPPPRRRPCRSRPRRPDRL